MTDIHVGLVGFGMAGRVFHAPAIEAVDGLRLAAIVQRRGDSAAAACPGVRIVRTLDELLALDEIRLVVIATPNSSHAELARRCLRAGRHVVVDKPFAPSSAEAAPLIEEAERAGTVLSVYHNRRFDGDFLTVERLHRAGACGRTIELESCWDRYRPQLKAPARPGAWKERAEPGGGLLFDIGPHLVDQAVTLFGRPDAITADVRVERDGAEADDAFDVVLHYEPRRQDGDDTDRPRDDGAGQKPGAAPGGGARGSRAVLRASMLACEPRPRFILRGTGGTFVKQGFDPQEALLSAGERPAGEAWGREPEDRWGVLTRPVPGAGVTAASTRGALPGSMVREKIATEAGDYRRYYENVREAIRGRAPLAVTARQALDVIRILELALESSRRGTTLDARA